MVTTVNKSTIFLTYTDIYLSCVYMFVNNKKNHDSAAWFSRVNQNSQSEPLYRQIKSQILMAISSRVFLPGDVFLSEVELARISGVTRATVRQATNELVAEGMLIREKGKRPRVAKPKTVAHFLELAGISQYIEHGDSRYVCKVLNAKCEHATSEIAQLLRIRKSGMVFVLERLRSDGDIIFGWERTWMNTRLFAGIDRYDFSRESLYHVLKHDYGIVPSYAEGVIDVLVADSTSAKIFGVREGTPLVSVHRTVSTEDSRPIQVNHEIYRGDCYSFAFKASNK
jgi:GntR family transcriptional regulator